MGLFSSIGQYLSSDPTQQQVTQKTPDQLSTYNDDVVNAKIARRRAIADMLTKQAQQGQQGQFIRNGDFIGYAGGNTLGSALMQGLQGYLGAKQNEQADQAAIQQGADRTGALATRLGIMNGILDENGNPIVSPTDKANAAALSDALQFGDTEHGANGLKLKDAADALYKDSTGDIPSAQIPDLPDSSSSDDTTSPINLKSAAKAILATTPSIAGAGRGSQGGPTAEQAAAVARLMQSGNLFANDRPGQYSNVGVGAGAAKFALPDPYQSAVVMNGAAPMPSPQTSGASGSWVPNAATPAPAMPPMQAANAPTSVQTPPPAAVAPAQAAAPLVDPRIYTAGQLSGPGFATPAQIAAATPAPRTLAQQQADTFVNLAKLAQTGPQGAAIAQGIQQDMFSKNGRFTTTVEADRVNGGFVKTTTDTRTGESVSKPIGGGVGPDGRPVQGGAFTETTGADGTRMKVFKNGASSVPITDGTGAPVQDPTVLRSNDEQKIKVGAAVNSNQAARSAVDSSLARLDRIEQLYKETETGPVSGKLPNWTAKRQELHALLAQDIFAETRDAVSGAADAGGAPKMTQREFEFMKDNGGLSQDTLQPAAVNIISQQRLRLNALRSSLAKYSGTLEGAQPSGNQSVPARGQTTTAASRGF